MSRKQAPPTFEERAGDGDFLLPGRLCAAIGALRRSHDRAALDRVLELRAVCPRLEWVSPTVATFEERGSCLAVDDVGTFVAASLGSSIVIREIEGGGIREYAIEGNADSLAVLPGGAEIVYALERELCGLTLESGGVRMIAPLEVELAQLVLDLEDRVIVGLARDGGLFRWSWDDGRATETCAAIAGAVAVSPDAQVVSFRATQFSSCELSRMGPCSPKRIRRRGVFPSK